MWREVTLHQVKEMMEDYRWENGASEAECNVCLKKKISCPFFHFLFPWTIKCCSTHLSPPLVWHRSGSDTESHSHVCCEVPFISSCHCQPRSHVFTGGTQRDAAWKWHLRFGENRMAQRYHWWKALQNLRQTETGWTVSFQI